MVGCSLPRLRLRRALRAGEVADPLRREVSRVWGGGEGENHFVLELVPDDLNRLPAPMRLVFDGRRDRLRDRVTQVWGAWPTN